MKLIQKHRIYPNQTHREILEKQFGCCRFVWNYFVARQRELGYNLSYNEMAQELTYMVKPQYVFLKEIVAQCLQQTLIDLGKANRAKANPPKFKKKRWRQSCRYAQYTRVNKANNLLYLPKMMNDPIKIILERDLPEYTMCTIVKESDDTYYACFWIERDHIQHDYDSSLKHVGIDLGLKDLLVLSSSKRVEAPNFFRKLETNVSRKGRALDKKKKRSREWIKCRKRLSKAQAKVRRQRLDFIHKISHTIATDSNIMGISVESLNIKQMTKNRNLSKSISDAAWSLLISTLNYKLIMRGKVLTSCGGMFPSTQLCSHCHVQSGPETLKTREWTCDVCGTCHDRDLNAAMNIAAEGDRLYHYGKVA